jgi:hypothetical protein
MVEQVNYSAQVQAVRLGILVAVTGICAATTTGVLTYIALRLLEAEQYDAVWKPIAVCYESFGPASAWLPSAVLAIISTLFLFRALNRQTWLIRQIGRPAFDAEILARTKSTPWFLVDSDDKGNLKTRTKVLFWLIGTIFVAVFLGVHFRIIE